MALRSLPRIAAAGAGAALLLCSSPALAHWCNCLWASNYNLIVRPAQDSVSVPAGGTATLDVYVQNNMGYPLFNFQFMAKASGKTTVSSITGPDPKVVDALVGGSPHPYLMPGEKLKQTLTIKNSGTSAQTVPVENIDFYVDFGDPAYRDEGDAYGTGNPHQAVVIKKNDGTLAPAAPISGLGNSGDQALNLGSMAVADFGTTSDGIDALVTEYCLGRGSWASGVCTGSCPAPSGSPSNYDVEHLWSSSHLAARKSVLSASQLATIRASLQCGWSDKQPVMKTMAAFALGYLGDDAAHAASGSLKAVIADGTRSSDDKLVAKAALLLMGDATYKSDVTAGVTGGGEAAQDACAGALGIVDQNDAVVTSVLIARARWICPAECGSEGTPSGTDNPLPFLASHILEVVTWDRRGFATMAGDTGYPAYYATGTVVPPSPPASASCSASAGGTVRATWAAVSSAVSYNVYWDTASHPSCTKPADAGCNYAHRDTGVTGTYKDYPSSDGTQTLYYRVTAVDGTGAESDFSPETTGCVPLYAPVASLVCTPDHGSVPPDLAVTCDASGSSDANGSADIASYSFKLDAAAPQAGTASSASYTFSSAATHTVLLTVTDSKSLTDTATATITVSAAAADGGAVHNPPVAKTTGTSPTSGAAPLLVHFDGSQSTGDSALTYSWDFGDNSAADTSQKPDHTYATAGNYTASLTVTDLYAATGTAMVAISVTSGGGEPPDLSSASASPLSGLAPLKVHFDATGAKNYDGDQAHLTVTWDFGDHSATSTKTADDHTYPAAGTYTATLSGQDTRQTTGGSAQRTFTITVTAPEGAPDCSNATVTPQSGAAPLAVHMDASACTDPSKHNLTFEWHVPVTPEVVLKTAQADYTFASAGQWTIHLIARNDAPTPLSTQTDFQVTATGGPATGADGGGTPFSPTGTVQGKVCGCTSAASGPSMIALLVIGLALRRRRR